MKTIATRLAAAALLGIASALAAQTVSDSNEVPTTGLDLPRDLTTFGPVDQHVRKATAIINDEIITGTDIDQRLALIAIANGGKIPDEERERLRLQVLRNLIDETLQIQEAKSHDITISREEVDQSYARVSRNFKRTPEAMTAFLRQNGSSDRSVKRQIQGELAWSRLLRRRVEPQVNVSDEEVKAILDKLEANKGAKEFHVGEIYLQATPENVAEVTANAQRIIEQLKKGGSFAAYARQFSEASTASVGGDLGWVQSPQLPDAIAAVVQDMQVGQLVGPIPVAGGVSIVFLVDSRQVLTADPRDAILNLRQLSLKFAPNTSTAEATARAESFAKATQAMAGCGKVEQVAAQQGAEVVDNDAVKVRDLPSPLQAMLLKLSVGQSTPPFGSREEGVRVLVLCGRDEPRSANAPSPDQIRSGIEETRVNQRAQRYLRDLRRDAVVDYR